MGEALDSEAVREVLSRYFDEMRGVLEHHGGTVEKYIGDAIMAVFGLPTVHEDDALRAVRAAFEMQRRLAVLNDELERVWGVRLTNRTGVNTGEVVAGDATTAQRLVTGDVVNVAARLEQAAPALEVLIGEPTYRLVRGAVDVEEVEPLELKGKSERVAAYRLIGVKDRDGVARNLDNVLVGRDRELELLRGELDSAIAQDTCRLVTVVAEAGVGKSRLLEELERTTGDALVLRGRCLPYGRGITFWPLVEAVRAAAGIREDDLPDQARARIAALLGEGREEVVARVAAAVGLSDDRFTVDELFWGVRRLCEILGSQRPLVLVFEDIHWAEETFLDLVEHVVATCRGAPVVVCCASRPDLYERRNAWGTSTGGAKVALQPLTDDESRRVVDHLLGDAQLEDRVRTRIVDAAEGNPLFVEQLLSMMVDEGILVREGDRWIAAEGADELSVPPTIQALLAARLDLLTREERAVIEPAAVIGVTFPQEAVAALAPDAVRPGVDEHLSALVRKRLLRTDPSMLMHGPVLRFDHVLIRDAAYNALLKRARATLHEKFVDWADGVNADSDRALQYEEILGYHLEQAHAYLAELGPLDTHGRELGTRASERLGAAGRRAFARNDMGAAANLLRRAAQLLPEGDAARLDLLPDLGEALLEVGEFAWAQLFLEEAAAAAAANGDERLAAEVAIVQMSLQRFTEKLDAWTDSVLEEAQRVIETFERAGDDAALARAWRLVMNAYGVAERFGDAATAAERAGEHARRAGDGRQESNAAFAYAQAALYGPTPVPEAIARCEAVLARASGDRRLEGVVMCLLAPLRAMQGEFEVARDLYVRGRSALEEIGARTIAANMSLKAYTVELLAGDLAAAERELRETYEVLERMDERYLRPTVAGFLAGVLWMQDRHDEAERFAAIAEEVAASDDVGTQALWRSARAKILVRDGRFDEAVEVAGAAVELLQRTDGLGVQADALIALADVLRHAGRVEEADRAAGEALALYERKGNGVAATAIHASLTR